MDIQRASTRSRRWRTLGGPLALAGLLIGLTALAIVVLNRPPGLGSEQIWVATVGQGEILREISATGTIVAPRLRAVTTRNAGVVEQVLVLPGDPVDPGSILLIKSNPDLDEDLAQAAWELAATEAEQAIQQVEIENRQLDLVAQLAQARAEYTSALIELQAQEELAESQVFSAIEVERSRLRVEQLQRRLEAEEARLARAPEHRAAQQAATEAKLARQRDKISHLEGLIELLRVPAGSTGLIQEVNIQEGERLSAGEVVARIVDPTHLIARLRVPEREAADVQLDMPVRLELGPNVIQGQVSRIDPTARDRHIDVDVRLTSNPLPPLRPDQSIQGRLELERLDNVLFLPRPAQARQEGQRLKLFVLRPDSRRARRAEVELGRLSAREVEIISGLRAGDRVIMSDMSEFNGIDEVRLR